MDVFQLRQHVLDTYAAYTTSFLTIADPAIHAYVHAHLAAGTLWPDALIQLSPAYTPAETVATLVAHHVLHPRCGEIFVAHDGATTQALTLYRHQREALDLAQQRKHYVVTTGTGSGKSLTYLIPIIDYVVRHQPERGQVRAILVYPMNALINSQEIAINAFLDNLPAEQRDLIRVKRYTGQEREQEKRDIQAHPPHILLTNYVMLELMLTRPAEYRFVEAGMSDLQFVVLDELHTYRGRQGADVALLIRRLRERCGNPQLVCVGTSATMARPDPGVDPRALVAAVASTIFGAPLGPDQIITETLTRTVSSYHRPTREQLRAVLHAPLPATLSSAAFRQHPLAAWVEDTFSLAVDPHTGQLVRAKPKSLREGATLLAAQTDESVQVCEAAIHHFFQLGTSHEDGSTAPFAFKLHQFISQGGAVYATADLPEQRVLTLEGQRAIGGAGSTRLLFPQVFCRECGQHYALCAYDPAADRVDPRHPLSRGEDVTRPAMAGYLAVDDGLWSDEDSDRLPDTWFRITRRGRTILREYQAFLPRRLFVRADGSLAAERGDATPCWFLPSPFLTCLRCGVVYTKREDDFRKVARLSSEGRSTATTLLSAATIEALRRSDLKASAKKLLSFTDNRQDASLQAGHFNDFASVATLRSAIARTLAAQAADDPLTHATIAARVCATFALPQARYANDVGTTPMARKRNEDALTLLLEYRIYEDLRRSWRVTQPNLEQCGLLRIDYLDLDALCAEPTYWVSNPVLHAASGADRTRTIRALLEHMRCELALDAPRLDPEQQTEWVNRYNAKVNVDWKLDDHEVAVLRKATRYVLPSDEPLPPGGRSLATRTAVGRFLRSPEAWPHLAERLTNEDYEALLRALLTVLIGANILTGDGEGAALRSVQIRHDALLWCGGAGTVPEVNPIRARRLAGSQPAPRQVNSFFRELYLNAAERLRAVEGREHTGQVPQEIRVEREQRFRDGDLPVLFCSPTMELGIDIADLNVVHMRNVPPTPANYAQRSGRAGRSGQAALVLTYCAMGSGHDQYFFQRPLQMVAGAVAPPQIELANEDLVLAHIHAIWLAATGFDLMTMIPELIATDQPDLPLYAEVRHRLTLDAAAAARCRALCAGTLHTVLPLLSDAPWFHAGWLDERLAGAVEQFDRAFDRWRELYQLAETQLQAALTQRRRAHSRGSLTPRAIKEADRSYHDAVRQKDVLCNLQSGGKSTAEFYPYRYLASEGFLPGYNFPRLPVRAFLRTDSDDGTFLARPRFLALAEFGPQNIIYHEGRKYQVVRSMLPAGSAEQRLRAAKVCTQCGYFHEGLSADVCEQCGTPFHDQQARVFTHLFEMTTVSTRRIERITCEEEERRREGYRITTHYRFAAAGGTLRRVRAQVHGAGVPPLALSYGAQATIWRMNHGWKRARTEGFTLDLQHGLWNKAPDEAEAETGDPLDHGSDRREDVRIVVHDTRNILLLQCDPQVAAHDEQIMSLQHALQRGIKEYFQLEDQELQTELLGEGALRQILIWEAAEGGAGVLRRLVDEPDTLAQVARTALELCHFDPATGTVLPTGVACARACYRCLLTYSNQTQHARLNRYAVRDLLLSLAAAHVERDHATPPAPATTTLTAPLRRVLDYLRANDGREPLIEGEAPMWYLRMNRTCLLCPAGGEDVTQVRAALRERGRIVYVIDPDQDVGEQLAAYTFWKT